MDVYIDDRRKKRTARENPCEDEFVAGDVVGVKKRRSGDDRGKRAKKASETEVELNRVMVKEQRKQLSNFETEKFGKKIVNSGGELTESSDGLRKSGGGRTRALVDRKALNVNGSVSVRSLFSFIAFYINF